MRAHEPADEQPPGARPGAWRLLRRGASALVGVAAVALGVQLAFTGPVVSPVDPAIDTAGAEPEMPDAAAASGEAVTDEAPERTAGDRTDRGRPAGVNRGGDGFGWGGRR